ncbi:hypothetical protein QTP88_024153 [Uroleucon formosanum]
MVPNVNRIKTLRTNSNHLPTHKIKFLIFNAPLKIFKVKCFIWLLLIICEKLNLKKKCIILLNSRHTLKVLHEICLSHGRY